MTLVEFRMVLDSPSKKYQFVLKHMEGGKLKRLELVPLDFSQGLTDEMWAKLESLDAAESKNNKVTRVSFSKELDAMTAWVEIYE